VGPVGPKLHLAGPCGAGQTLCFLSGGMVPAKMSNTSLDASRPKICVMTGDPLWGCGTCTRFLFAHVERTFCSPKGTGTQAANYTTCQRNWEDRDGNRANGCETWVATKYADGWQRPPAQAVPATRCTADSECPEPRTDIKCV